MALIRHEDGNIIFDEIAVAELLVSDENLTDLV
jgi:hypothetical protein